MSHERADSVKQAQYDHWHEAMSLGEESKSPLTFPWYARVALELSLYKGGNLLEIGCGRGSFALWLASQRAMFHITGVDFSRTAIEIARARAQKSDLPVTFVEGDAESLPFSKETFDVVVSCECMEHVANPQLMACEMARVLKAGGKFILTTENYLNGMLLAWIMCALRRVPFNSGSGVQPHENFFLFWMAASYLRRAGLRIQKTDSSHFQWLLLPHVDPAKLCTTAFRAPLAQRIARPFGRHYCYIGMRPVASEGNRRPI